MLLVNFVKGLRTRCTRVHLRLVLGPQQYFRKKIQVLILILIVDVAQGLRQARAWGDLGAALLAVLIARTGQSGPAGPPGRLAAGLCYVRASAGLCFGFPFR